MVGDRSPGGGLLDDSVCKLHFFVLNIISSWCTAAGLIATLGCEDVVSSPWVLEEKLPVIVNQYKKKWRQDGAVSESSSSRQRIVRIFSFSLTWDKGLQTSDNGYGTWDIGIWNY